MFTWRFTCVYIYSFELVLMMYPIDLLLSGTAHSQVHTRTLLCGKVYVHLRPRVMLAGAFAPVSAIQATQDEGWEPGKL
jgi:hypothetical protein